MVTSTTTSTSDPAFHADDVEQTNEYSTLSALAVVSLVFGLASPFCLGAPLLMAIPIVGAAISILALLRIAASDGVLAGRWAATVGLALCVACGVGAITHKSVIRALRSHQAQSFGRSWIELLLAGKTDDAFRLTVEGLRSASPPEIGAPAPTKTPRDAFASAPIITELLAAGSEAYIRFDGTLSYEPQSSRYVRLQQKFTVTPKNSADDPKRDLQPREVTLAVTRANVPGEANLRWLVSSYAESSPSTDSSTSR